jgi:hypothetical protein
MKYNPLFIIFFALFLFASCEKPLPTNNNSGGNVNPESKKKPPVANAGPDQVINPPAILLLDGSKSSDPDNNIVSYKWTKISGPSSFKIGNDTAVQTQVTNLGEGTYSYSIELKVTDADGLFDTDTVIVVITARVQNCGDWVCVNVPSFSTKYSSTQNFYQAYGASVTSQNKAYFAGGTDDFTPYGGSYDNGLEFDPDSKSFRNFKLSVPRSFLAGETAGNKILFAGGEDVSRYLNYPVYNTVDIYDNQTLTHTVATLNEARSHLASASLGSQAFFIGGKRKEGFSNKMDIYNSTNNSWQVITMPHARGYAGAAIIGNKLYIAGGQNSNGNIRTIDVYEIQYGQWASLEAPNNHTFSSVVSINNKLIVAGGDGLNNKSADIYNTTTGQWSSVNLSSSRFKMAVATVKNKVVFLGGAYSFTGQYFSNETGEIDIYDDTTGGWAVGSVSPGVCGMMAASVGSQIIYVGFMWGNTTTNTMITLLGN